MRVCCSLLLHPDDGGSPIVRWEPCSGPAAGAMPALLSARCSPGDAAARLTCRMTASAGPCRSSSWVACQGAAAAGAPSRFAAASASQPCRSGQELCHQFWRGSCRVLWRALGFGKPEPIRTCVAQQFPPQHEVICPALIQANKVDAFTKTWAWLAVQDMLWLSGGRFNRRAGSQPRACQGKQQASRKGKH